MVERGKDVGLIERKEFKSTFLYQFFLLELRDAKIQEFINLLQENMHMKECTLKFTMLSRYAPFIIVDPRKNMSKFISDISSLVSKECKMAMIVK